MSMSGKELLLGSSFRLGTGGEDGARAWTAWGRFAAGGFEGADDGLTLSGDVATGFLGADVSQARWLAGLAVGVSEGEGSFDDGTGAAGTVESSLTSMFPYARLGLGHGVDLWGMAGAGSGDLKLTVGEEVTETGLSFNMGALGLRADLMPVTEAGDVGLALTSDALWVQTESDAAGSSTGGNLAAASGEGEPPAARAGGLAGLRGRAWRDGHADARARAPPRWRRCGNRHGRGGRLRAAVRRPGPGSDD